MHLARVCGLRAVPVIVIEQVSGFPHHGHFHQVLSAWRQAGYRVVCRGSVNLHDVLPTSRLRFLLVLAHHSLPDDDGLAQFVWPERLSTSLGQAHAVFDMPPEMHSASLLDPQLLQVYLDPLLMPGKFQQHPRATPAKHRVVTESQVATCFMAQYGYAHELPRDLLEAKGLHGSLLQQGSTARFFSAPEIASAMGALSPIWCPHDRRLSHRILGNCISVPHAILGLHCACQALGIANLPGAGCVLKLALSLRLHNINSVFIPLQEGWILCHKRDVSVITEQLGQCLPFDLPAGKDVSVDTLFGQAVLRRDVGECRLHLPQPLLPSGALQLIGYPPHAAAEWMRDCVDAFAVAVEELPGLGPRGIQGPLPSLETVTVLAESEVYVLSRGSPMLWAQIQAIGQHVTAGSANELVLLDVHGRVLDEASQLPRCCVATCTHGDCHFLSLALLAAAVPHFEVRPCRVDSREGWLLSVRPEVAGDCWLGFPFSVVSGIGWSTQVANFPPAGCSPTVFTVLPAASLRFSWTDVGDLMFVLLIVAQLAAVTASQHTAVHVEVQIVARLIWKGSLPRTTTFESVANMWTLAATACQLEPECRVLSGPFPHLPDDTLEDALQSSTLFRRGSTGCYLLNLHPPCHGGGVKDENVQLAKARTAALMLDKGVPLHTASHTVDALVQKVGARPLLAALQVHHTADRWAAVAQVAEGCQVELPTSNGKVEKAAARIQKSFRQRQAQQTAKVKSSELALIEGTWRNAMDEQPVPTLDQPGPDMHGVMLLDACDATPQELARLSAVASDALCVVIPGHECPAPDTCSGRLSVPVIHRLTASQHLVAACHHNLGCVDIVPYSCHDAEVSATAMVCCSFVMYRDEASSPEAWTRLSQRPVRAVAEALRGSGLEQPFTSPWGRSFRAAGKPTAPEIADTFMVQAKVSQTILRQALKVSGWNGVNMVPRAWEHQPLPGWDIKGMKGPRCEVARHARVLPEQHGIVRGSRLHVHLHQCGPMTRFLCRSRIPCCARWGLSRLRRQYTLFRRGLTSSSGLAES